MGKSPNAAPRKTNRRGVFYLSGGTSANPEEATERDFRRANFGGKGERGFRRANFERERGAAGKAFNF
ncbi:MAG: hypothetical protein IJZ10_09395 [Thermoguttaceae bacterium]|nr:hypothetical protein [Thermoguttaceae bacterium]